jgi:hypothetical protein
VKSLTLPVRRIGVCCAALGQGPQSCPVGGRPRCVSHRDGAVSRWPLVTRNLLAAADCKPTSGSCRSAPRHNPKTASARPPRWGRFFGTGGGEKFRRGVFWIWAQSSGKLYELLRALKARDGDRAKKLFQFLNDIGARALRIQLGRVLEMAESSPDKYAYENKIAERFGGQKELELVVPMPSVIPSSETKEAAN